MKKICLYGVVYFCVCINSYAQKIQYSRQTVKKLYTDELQLVPNINGNHHLIRFNVNKNPVISIYNGLLQLESEETIDYKLKNKVETYVLPFRNYYYLYLHPVGTPKHTLYKIDGSGTIESLSEAFQQVVDTALNKTTSLQLINQNNRLYVVAHAYYDAIKKIGSTVVELNNEMKPVAVQKVFFDFNAETEGLRQTTLAGNCLLVLKTGATDEGGQSLEMMSIDLAGGDVITRSFNSANSRYVSAAFRQHPRDSTVLVHAMLALRGGDGRRQSTSFISVLNRSLEEATPFALFRSQFRNNADATYFLLNDYACWLTTTHAAPQVKRLESSQGRNDRAGYPLRYFRGSESRYTSPTLPPGTQLLSYPQPMAGPERSAAGSQGSRTWVTAYNLQGRVNFTMVDRQLKAVADSVVSETKDELGIQPSPAVQALVNNKASLFLIQNFSESRRRLLMIAAGGPGEFASTDINVYDKYEYLLEQLQAVSNNSVILPYTHKSEAGLVKISFD
jgi:hypothetical protein